MSYSSLPQGLHAAIPLLADDSITYALYREVVELQRLVDLDAPTGGNWSGRLYALTVQIILLKALSSGNHFQIEN